MSVTNLELHGVDAPLDEEIILRTGPFEAVFEPARAYLRRVRINGVESVRNVYLHTRGADWSTVLPTVSNLQQTVSHDRFELTWHAVHRQGGIDFEWEGKLTGTPFEIYYRCDGVATHEFKTNRTGLCALIPREFQGQTAHIVHADGAQSSVVLPTHIAPIEPLREMHSVTVGPVQLTFEGDKFEAEDQRNWSDASFKCYPLRGRRQPAYTLKEGEKMMNAVRIEPTGSPLRVELATVPVFGRVLIGATVANDHDDLSGLAVDFLRVELPKDAEVARHLLDHARSAGLPLQVVVGDGGAQPDLLPKEVLIVSNAGKRPEGSAPVWLGAGSFDGFNMGRHEAKGFDGVEVSITPQIHTFDERSILENAATIRDVLGSVSAMAPGAQLGLNVHFKGDGPDPRLDSLFGALWIMRCYAAAAEFGACHLTLGSTAELRHPAVAALLKELGGKSAYRSVPVEAEGSWVKLESESTTLVGNLERSGAVFKPPSAVRQIRRLTPGGWQDAEVKNSGSLAPYGILAVS